MVCIVGATMTMQLFQRASSINRSWQAGWIALSGLACGSAIWTTHFVAMLGFRSSLDHAFDPLLTVASLGIAIAFTATGLYIGAKEKSSIPPEMGGVVIGIGIAAMHYTGMLGFQVAGHIVWDAGVVGASVFFSIAFGAMAMHLAAGHRYRYSTLLSVVFMVLAICAMHFTAMSAVSIVPDPQIEFPPMSLSSEFLAVIVVAIMVTITGATLYAIDMRSRLDVVDSLRHAAEHDPLTGLPNRAYLANKVPDILKSSEDFGYAVAVFTLDLDRFKEINDVHGHRAGDHVLKTLATRFERAGTGELVARLGGDEFVAIKSNVSSRSEIDAFAAWLVQCVVDPVYCDADIYRVGVSVGISVYPDDAATIDELITASDLSMYRAKNSPSDQICYYDHALDERRRERSALALELRQAIDRDELELHYQSQHNALSEKIVGYEVLLRWNHRSRGLVGPDQFIPVAEESDLIIDIGNWVLRTACREAAGWKKAAKISVNIAAAQLTRSDLPAIVNSVLKETGLRPSRLILELTEAGLIEDRARALSAVKKLKALGVSIAMDDYGVGYSSLVTFQMFPFDKVKIDRSFIENVTTDRTSAAIVKATVLLAKQLDISVLAEGVETPEAYAFLRSAGCTEVQGFLFGRPVPIAEVAARVGRPRMTPNAGKGEGATKTAPASAA